MEEKHPVQALVWGIVDLVVACVGLLFIIPEIVLPIVYTAMKAGGQVPEADLRTVATTFFVIVVVFGVIVFFMGLGSLIIRSCTKSLYVTPYDDGRYHSGVTTRKIALPFAIVEIVAAVLATTFSSLALVGIF
jgi:hypothetical protein